MALNEVNLNPSILPSYRINLIWFNSEVNKTIKSLSKRRFNPDFLFKVRSRQRDKQSVRNDLPQRPEPGRYHYVAGARLQRRVVIGGRGGQLLEPHRGWSWVLFG